MTIINKNPVAAGDRNQKGATPRTLPTSGVVLPVVLTLLVQASVSMSAVAIPVFMPVAAGELNIPPSYVGIIMSLIYLGATVFAPVSGYFIDRFGPIGISQICLGDEYSVAVDELGMPLDALKERVLAAAQAAFLPDAERQALVASLEKELSGVEITSAGVSS